ncbi:MAG: DUF1192 domain-containing protein [Nitratireductor sp.]|nr:DUF1192 domain-containing protein [Nitratireductor sp.]
MFDEEPIRKRRVFEIGQKLEELSVEDLDETIAVLKAEIERLESARSAKSDHLSAAEALFARRE